MGNYGMLITTLLWSLIIATGANRIPYTSELNCGGLTNKQSCVESNCRCAWCSLQTQEGEEVRVGERGVIRRSGMEGFCFKKDEEDQKKKTKSESEEGGSGNCDGGQIFENGSCIGGMEVGLILLLVASAVACVSICFLCLCCKFCWCL